MSATNVSQFAQPKKHHGQQCVFVYQGLNIIWTDSGISKVISLKLLCVKMNVNCIIPLDSTERRIRLRFWDLISLTLSNVKVLKTLEPAGPCDSDHSQRCVK